MGAAEAGRRRLGAWSLTQQERRRRPPALPQQVRWRWRGRRDTCTPGTHHCCAEGGPFSRDALHAAVCQAWRDCGSRLLAEVSGCWMPGASRKRQSLVRWEGPRRGKLTEEGAGSLPPGTVLTSVSGDCEPSASRRSVLACSLLHLPRPLLEVPNAAGEGGGSRGHCTPRCFLNPMTRSQGKGGGCSGGTAGAFQHRRFCSHPCVFPRTLR